MKVISIWQPYASLAVHGHKVVETRGWPAPKSLIGKTIGIASTKNIQAAQRQAFKDDAFRYHFDQTGLPELVDLPHGCVLGTVQLHSCDVITEEDLEDITEAERLFGWWEVGRYAWRLRYPRPFPEPIPAKGAQGIWNWDPHVGLEEAATRKDPTWSQDRRPHLRLVE
ncbi:MAG: ASCH domain-containing protein [Roseibium sp.]|nr:ASCH domain-containing protein [Roseibium sp.]